MRKIGAEMRCAVYWPPAKVWGWLHLRQAWVSADVHFRSPRIHFQGRRTICVPLADYQEPKKVTHHGHKKSPITGIKK